MAELARWRLTCGNLQLPRVVLGSSKAVTMLIDAGEVLHASRCGDAPDSAEFVDNILG